MKVDLNTQSMDKPRSVEEGRQSLIIYEGLYPNPDQTRRYALTLNYGRGEFDSYAGENSLDHHVSPQVSELISHLVNAPIIIRKREEFGVFRRSFENDPCENFIHADPEGWGGVAYLNPPQCCIGGTAFWRHKETGLEQFPWTDWRNYGFESLTDAWLRLVCEDGNIPEKWEIILFVPARYNRLILFNSKLFHSHMPRENFGKSVETARLVQVFFFRTDISAL